MNNTSTKLSNFSGLSIASFESRMSDVMVQAVEKKGGKILSAPSMQEIPFDKNPEVFSFVEKLLMGQVDMIVFMTGVGTKMMMEVIESRYDKAKVIEAISKTTVVARGPKPTVVLRNLGIPISLSVPEPNTYREILETLDLSSETISLNGKTVAIQEYGVAAQDLIDGLKKRGARVVQVPVYRWALPDDIQPMQNAIRAIVDELVQIVFFTTGMQIRHVVQVAAQMGMEKQWREAMKKVVIASIGPICSEAIRDVGLQVDFEPTHPKLGQLVSEMAAQAHSLVDEKKVEHVNFLENCKGRVQSEDLRLQSPFLKACRRETVPYTPVWLMRQAGRYMKEYQRIRDKVSFLELCRNPELCAQVTIEACEKLKVDAAIIFSDILLIVQSMGLGLEFAQGDGPVISGQLHHRADVDRLREVNPNESLSFVYDAIRLTRSHLDPKTPLIGFSGAPFTLAAYMIEGGGSKNFLKAKKFMREDSGAWHALMEKISRGVIQYLKGQIAAGADAVQIFDSWVGCLSPADFREYVMPHTKNIVSQLENSVPVIHFGTGTSPFLKEMREAGGDVIGVDFHMDLDKAWDQIGYDRAIQGNMDPAILFSSFDEIKKSASRILDQANGHSGHIFNLGHGILPGTPVQNVIDLVQFVHDYSSR